jgi:hypothetical protein
MKTKVLATMFLIGICLACSPALYACETCIKGGTTDPAGGSSTATRCYASDSGNYELCTPKSPDDGTCTMSDTNPSACPVSSSSSGSGTASGDTYDLSQGSYDAGSGGYCSAEYATCT